MFLTGRGGPFVPGKSRFLGENWAKKSTFWAKSGLLVQTRPCPGTTTRRAWGIRWVGCRGGYGARAAGARPTREQPHDAPGCIGGWGVVVGTGRAPQVRALTRNHHTTRPGALVGGVSRWVRPQVRALPRNHHTTRPGASVGGVSRWVRGARRRYAPCPGTTTRRARVHRWVGCRGGYGARAAGARPNQEPLCDAPGRVGGWGVVVGTGK